MIYYMPRSEWGGGSLKSGYRVPKSQFVGLVAHHTVSVMPDYDMDEVRDGDLDDVARYMRGLQSARPDLGLEVPYSFNLFKGTNSDDVVVAEGRGLGVTGAHTAGYNSTRYGVAVVGNTNLTEVTPGLIEGFKWVGRLLSDPVHARSTLGHRDVDNTACPGDNFYRILWQVQPPFNPSQGDWLTMASLEEVEQVVRKVIREELIGINFPPRFLGQLVENGAGTGVVYACNGVTMQRRNLTADGFAVGQHEHMGYMKDPNTGSFYLIGPETLQYYDEVPKVPE